MENFEDKPQYQKIPSPTKSFYSVVIKRMLDVVLSGIALVVLSPVLLVVAILEVVFHGRPVLYATKRPGKDGKIIKIYKFRSMTDERGADGLLLPENKRLTKFGYFIRKTSLDELPQLWSIFKGDMSIIGPRPLLIEYLDLYSPRYAMRQSVKPGLACVRIQREGLGDTCTWRDQFENDIYYIENISFVNDVKMVFAVLKEVIRGSEYRAKDNRVPFDGTNYDETRGKDEIENIVRYDSVTK